MTALRDPGLAPIHPRQALHSNLVAGASVIWHSETATDRVVLRYVLRILGVDYGALTVTSLGFGISADESVALITMRSPHGAAVCIKPLTEAGITRINDAIATEWEETKAALAQGSYVGNDGSAHHTVLVDGHVHEEYAGSDVIDFLNAAEVTHITGIG